MATALLDRLRQHAEVIESPPAPARRARLRGLCSAVLISFGRSSQGQIYAKSSSRFDSCSQTAPNGIAGGDRMASVGEPVRPASASAMTGETIPKNAGTPDPTFPRFLSAMSAARQAGTLHHLTPSDDQAHSLPLNAAVSDNSMPQTGSVFATWLFVSLCLTIIAIAFIAVAHSRFAANSETYAPIDGTKSKEKIEADDLQVNPMPRVSDVTPGKDVRAKTSAVSAEVRSVQPHNDQHATSTAGLRRGADETTGDPGDPIGVTLAHASLSLDRRRRSPPHHRCRRG